MPEKVHTGGSFTFDYKNSKTPKLESQEKLEIREAYAKHYEKKQKQKRNKLILIIAIIVIIISTVLYLIF